jgi:hypothetical protein
MGPASDLGEDRMTNLARPHKHQQANMKKRPAPARTDSKARNAALRNSAKEMVDLRRRIRELQARYKQLGAQSSGHKTRICPKCSGKILSLRYDRSADECLRENRACETGEHLHFYCCECSYDWCGPIEPPDKLKPAPDKG